MTRLVFMIMALAVLIAPPARAQSVAEQARAGIAAAKEGEYNAAIQHFTLALAVPGISDAERDRLFLYRGFANQELGLYDAAIGDFTQAIALGSAAGQAYYRRAIAHREKGEFTLALADFNAALDRRDRPSPDWPFIHGDRGVVYFALGRYADAIRDFERLHELEPDDDYAALWLDVARARSGLPPDIPARTKEWPAPLIAVLRGDAPKESAMQAATEDDDEVAQKNRICEAHFFLGEFALLKGDKKGAHDDFKPVLDQCSPSLAVHAGASAELSATAR